MLAILDIFGTVGGMFLGFLLGKYVIHAGGTDIDNYLAPIIFYGLLASSFIYAKKKYGRLKDSRPEEELRSVVTGCSWALFSMITLNFIFFNKFDYYRYIFIVGYLASLILVILFRFSLRELLNCLWNYGLAQENVIIAGDSATYVRWLMSHLHIQRYRGFNILGYMARKPSEDFRYGLKYLGNFRELAALAQQQRVDKVFFALQGYSDQRHKTLMSRLEECSALGIPTMIISHVFNDFFFSLTMDGYSSIFVLERKKPAYARPFYCFLKRSIDISGSLLILAVSLPFWLLAVVCIKAQDGGPILFNHSLVGKDEKLPDLKFRTMMKEAQEILENDPDLFRNPRELQTGDILGSPGSEIFKKYSLDELLQLINILKGDMSWWVLAH